jgi:hypothetical protein
MKRTLRVAMLAVLIGAGSVLACTWAEEPAPPPDPMAVDGFDGPVFFRRAAGHSEFGGGVRHEMRRIHHPDPARSAEMRAFHEIIERLRSAKEGPQKEAVKKELSQLLDKSFTRDLERREKEVAEIESRLKKLHDQIERRKKAKDEITSLRLKTIINETEGLGFSGPFGFERPTIVEFGPAEFDAVPAPGHFHAGMPPFVVQPQVEGAAPLPAGGPGGPTPP